MSIVQQTKRRSMTSQLIKAYTIETSPIDYQNTFNFALYNLAAGHYEESDRL